MKEEFDYIKHFEDYANSKDYVAKAVGEECLKVAKAEKGFRNNQLYECGLKLANFVAGGYLEKAHYDHWGSIYVTKRAVS